MELTDTFMKHVFSEKDRARGKAYYLQGRVTDVHIESGREGDIIRCTVKGDEPYSVKISMDNAEGMNIYCSCPQFKLARKCKHITAALIYYQNKGWQKQRLAASDQSATAVLKAYRALSQVLPDDAQNKIRLVPNLSTAYGQSYPVVSLTVGDQRLYKVKNIDQFLDNVDKKNTVSYGKLLNFCHELSAFDETSQQLIYLLMAQFPQYDATKGSSLDWEQSRGPRYYGYDKSGLVLRGNAFDRLFELYQGKELPLDGQPGMLEIGNPEITAKITPDDRGARMTVTTAGDASFFGHGNIVYALSPNKLLRCDTVFAEKLLPLVRQSSSMFFAKEDLPAFCSCVLPEITNLITLQDTKQLLGTYMPDDCEPCYYFDTRAGLGVVCELVFQYGKVRVSDSTPQKEWKNIKRNARIEDSATQMMTRYLKPVGMQGLYHLEDEDEIIELLTQHLDAFRSVGTVYVSEQLRSKRITPGKASVGISVSGGMLRLSVDLGEFPAEELEALYTSLLKKRRYHKLRDGRFLELGNTAYEKIAEMSHMIQLPAKALKSGSVALPTFRGLYLDQLLHESGELQVDRDSKFRSMIRCFKTVEDSEYAVPPSLESVLRPYQKTGFRWLKTLEENEFGGILADEMGLGKTLQIIAFLLTATRRNKGLASLIVCPASLVLNWGDEFAKFAPTLRVQLVIGDAAQRREMLEEDAPYDVLVTSYDLLKRSIEDFEKRKFYCCVLDEGQYIKNQSTLGSRAVKQIVCKQRFVLTGTPIENRLSELWNLFDFLMPGYLFSQKAFLTKLEKPIVQSGDAAAGRRLALLVQPFMLRRLKADVLSELPPKIEYVYKIQLSPEERKVYLATALAAKNSLKNGDGSKLKLLAALTRLRQICCDVSVCYENYEGGLSKMEACLELCTGMAENGHQILLFSQFTTVLAHMKQRLDALSISNFTLEGSTPKEKRAQLVKAFNAGQAQVFLISLKAGGTGLNLTAADIVIHYDPWWNIAAQNQATDRAHRIGQQAHVQVYKLIAQNTLEEKILLLQEKKAALMDTITQEFDESILTMPQEELIKLLE